MFMTLFLIWFDWFLYSRVQVFENINDLAYLQILRYSWKLAQTFVPGYLRLKCLKAIEAVL